MCPSTCIAVSSRYGFNSDGHVVVRQRLKKWKNGGVEGKVLGVNLGKNKDSKNGADDYVAGIRELGCYADYIVINISSPNTPGLRDMQGRKHLTDLLDMVREEGWVRVRVGGGIRVEE